MKEFSAPFVLAAKGAFFVTCHVGKIAALEAAAPLTYSESSMTPQKRNASDEGTDAIPKGVVSRMSLYLRELQHLVRDGSETTNSSQLGGRLGFSDAQVRKDLAYFGQFGYPGIGYKCAELIAAIREILGTDRAWPIAIVGVGNLGTALLGYKGFVQQGFRLAAAFDADRTKVGTKVAGIQITHIDDLETKVEEAKIRLALIAVPSTATQDVADRLVRAGVQGIVNFAPVTISLPEHVSHIGVDLAIELEQVAFAVVNRLGNR